MSDDQSVRLAAAWSNMLQRAELVLLGIGELQRQRGRVAKIEVADVMALLGAIDQSLGLIPVGVDTFVHLSLLADHARELVRIHREGWRFEDRTEAELVDAMDDDLEHIPPAVRA